MRFEERSYLLCIVPWRNISNVTVAERRGQKRTVAAVLLVWFSRGFGGVGRCIAAKNWESLS